MELKPIHIIMANYNRASFISQAIDSVLAQTSPVWHLHIGDDGSTDSSWNIIQSYLPHPQITCHRLPGPRGIIPTENFLFESCPDHSWLAILDSDDWLAPDAIQTMLQYIQANPAGEFFFSQMEYCSHDGQHTGKIFGAPASSIFSHLTRPHISHFKVFSKSLFTRLGGLDPRMLFGTEDTDFLFRMEEVTNPIHVPKVLYLYRKHPLSVTGMPRSRRQSGLIKHFSMFLAWKRRQGTSVPNFSRLQIAIKMLQASAFAFRYGYIKHSLLFFARFFSVLVPISR